MERKLIHILFLSGRSADEASDAAANGAVKAEIPQALKPPVGKEECAAVPRLQQEYASLPRVMILLAVRLLRQFLLLGQTYTACCSRRYSGHRIYDAPLLRRHTLPDPPVNGASDP